MKSLLTSVVLACIHAAGIGQTTHTWFAATPKTSPPAHVKHDMVYDAARNSVVLFGGHDGHQPLAQTWTYDGDDWTRHTTPTSLTPRESVAIAYDTRRARTVAFGGLTRTGTEIRETWEWDGQRWKNPAPITIPPARCAASLAADLLRGGALLFGGYRKNATLNDTWTWNGTDWRRVASGTVIPALGRAAMYFDIRIGRLVLLGGRDATGVARREAYSWSTNGWQRQPSHDLPKAQDVRVVYAWSRFAPIAWLDGLWEHRNGSWRRLSSSSEPGYLAGAAFAYDRRRDAIVAFGGHRRRSEFYETLTWEHRAVPSGAAWRPFGDGCGAGASAPEPILTHVDRSLPKLGTTLRMRVQGDRFVGPYALVLGASNTRFGAFRLPLNLHFLGAPQCSLRVSVDGNVPMLSSGGGRYDASLAVPRDATWLGLRLYVQAMQLGFPILTNAAVVTMGR